MVRSIRLLGIAGMFTLATTTANAQGWGQKLDDAINKKTNKDKGSNNNSNNSNNHGSNTNNNGSNSSGSNTGRGSLNLGQGLGSGEIVNGLKEALSIGAKNAGAKLNVTNGFLVTAL